MNKEEFLKEVRKEIETIRNIATRQELERLDFQHFNPISSSLCIYGQMTGWCGSKRAKEIYKKTLGYVGYCFSTEEIHNFKPGLGYTTLEAYIMFPGSPNEQIIKYLKKETNDLHLTLK